MYYERIFTDLGALIVDGPNYFEDFRPAGYIDRILKGAKPGKLPTERSAHMATDRVSFYDESLKKTIEGAFVSDGKKIHVSSVYGTKSASYGDLGACIDHNAQVLLAQKLLSELARGAAKDMKSH
jgi:hypothetical protein